MFAQRQDSTRPAWPGWVERTLNERGEPRWWVRFVWPFVRFFWWNPSWGWHNPPWWTSYDIARAHEKGMQLAEGLFDDDVFEREYKKRALR